MMIETILTLWIYLVLATAFIGSIFLMGVVWVSVFMAFKEFFYD